MILLEKFLQPEKSKASHETKSSYLLQFFIINTESLQKSSNLDSKHNYSTRTQLTQPSLTQRHGYSMIKS
ncbi:hypothetical protein GCM10007877_29360 [Marinibactrum halimedae]|uniref:Uncharacterized protein n=1 Tax=Marinibactrum halimedae TaxID=1444977 RepID=A0AA37WQG6_9GAMM|nr:hypothetical protein GCM10007877_29360 [Marinibactrum halimedae]